MTMPSTGPGPLAPEGRDTSGGNSVDPGEAARETAQIESQTEAAENYAQANYLAGYAGQGPLPTGGIDVTMTGADDVPGA
jgi:hypothetical protein